MRWLALFAIFWLPVVSAWAEGAVHLVLSEPEGAYEEAAQAFQDMLGVNNKAQVWSVRALSHEQVRRLTQDENLLVPIGLKANRFVAEHHGGHGAVLGLMVPRTSAEAIRWPSELGGGKLAYVYIDQPVERSLALLTVLLPQTNRIGAIVSQENGETLKALERETSRRGLLLNAAMVGDSSDVGPSLRRVLGDSEVFLLLPDAVVLGGANLQSLLMASYRLRVPVIGFSPGLVKSGAVAAVYSSPSQIGSQGGAMARRWLSMGSLPASQYAGQYSLDINNHVARSLGLSLPSEKEAARELGARD